MTEDDIRTELYRLRYQQKLLEMQANRLPDDNVIQELANIKTEIKNIKKRYAQIKLQEKLGGIKK